MKMNPKLHKTLHNSLHNSQSQSCCHLSTSCFILQLHSDRKSGWIAKLEVFEELAVAVNLNSLLQMQIQLRKTAAVAIYFRQSQL